jgi:hypothetical protein
MKIKMLRSLPGSDDGIVTQMYLVGKEYDVSIRLGNILLRGEDGEPFAELMDEKKMKSPVVENKMIEPKVENKVQILEEPKIEKKYGRGKGI